MLWFFYKVLPCTTFLEYDRLVIALSIPLLDWGKTFELYKMHTPPIPNQNNNLLAKYETRGNAIAVDDIRTTFAILNNNELEQCIKQEGDFCPLNSPFYPITANKECIIQLFLGKKQNINKHCKILIEPNQNDPRITYLSDGKWLIISSKVISFVIKCNTKVKQYSIKSPVYILTLRQGCTAFHGSLVLPPFYNKESTFDLSPSFDKLVKNFHFKRIDL